MGEPPLPPTARRVDTALTYADERTDRQRDLFSADREMTWRLARVNGWAALVLGVLGTLAAFISGMSGGGRWTVFGPVFATLLMMVAPGLVLLLASPRVQGGERGAVAWALAAGAWLACGWGAVALLTFAANWLSAGGLTPGWAYSVVTPVIILALLVFPAAKLVYHAVRVLAYGGRGGTRDRTSGLDTGVDATDQDLWRLVGRISLLRFAGGAMLLALAVACLAFTIIPAPPEEPEPPPAGTPFDDLYAPPYGMPWAARRQAIDLLDRDGVLDEQQRRELDDVLRHSGALFPKVSGFKWDWLVRTQGKGLPKPEPNLEHRFELPDIAGSVTWFGSNPDLSIHTVDAGAGLNGDTVYVRAPYSNDARRWSLGAAERWALSLKPAGGKSPTREQVLAVCELIYPPPMYEEGRPPVITWPQFEASVLEDGTLKFRPPVPPGKEAAPVPGGPDGFIYLDPNGSRAVAPWSQRRAEAIAGAPRRALLPMWPLWPALLLAVAVGEIVFAVRAWTWSRPGRRGEPVALTRSAARRMLDPQTRLALAALVVAAVTLYRASATPVAPRGILLSTPVVMLALAAVTWVVWTAVVLPGRVIELARRE